MHSAPGHTLNEVEGNLNFIEETTVPMMRQNVLTPLKGVVFAVIQRIVGHLDSKTPLVNEVADRSMVPSLVLQREL